MRCEQYQYRLCHYQLVIWLRYFSPFFFYFSKEKERTDILSFLSVKGYLSRCEQKRWECEAIVTTSVHFCQVGYYSERKPFSCAIIFFDSLSSEYTPQAKPWRMQPEHNTISLGDTCKYIFYRPVHSFTIIMFMSFDNGSRPTRHVFLGGGNVLVSEYIFCHIFWLSLTKKLLHAWRIDM